MLDESVHQRFDQLAPDTYFLEVQIDGFQTVIRPGVLVVAGAVVDVGTLTPIPIGNANGQIGGTLHFDNGKPAAGANARIALHVGNTDTFVAEVPSDAAGTYAALVQPGSYVVTGVHPLYLNKVSTPQPVVAGQVTTVALGLGAASTTTSAFWTCPYVASAAGCTLQQRDCSSLEQLVQTPSSLRTPRRRST